ncbi:MAG: RNA polymerase factor sigma-54 [Rhizobacter sp.]|nr:RNA polymerase factor sigma-54 [Chlorobiales bacterium]
MSQSLSQRQSQTMRLSPQQILYAKLLQLPTIQLEQRIKQELEENPMLEESLEETLEAAEAELGATAEPEPPAATLSETAADAPADVEPAQPSALTDTTADTTDIAATNGELKQDAAETKPDAAVEPIIEPATELPKVADEDFEHEIAEYLRDDYDGYKTSNFELKSGDDDGREFQQAYEESCSESLMEQLHFQSLTEKQFQIAGEIVGNIEDDGYLRCPLEAIADGLLTLGITTTEKEIEDVLEKIWYLDPVGIGARNLQECLLIQLRVLIRETDDEEKETLALLAEKMLGQYYTDFTMMHYEKLSQALGVSMQTLRRALMVIQHLNPKPGGGQGQARGNYITPDFVISFNGTELVATTTDRNAPQIRISNAYRTLLEDRSQPKATREFIKGKLDSARSFMTAIQMRQQTMRKVIAAMLKLQYEFFTEGAHKLKPMILKDVAEETGLDISTISRVANGKYVQTEKGTFELKYFFSASMETESGDEVSNRIIKQLIKDFIETEVSGKPLSDDKLAEMLTDKGYKVARRTVAKYREQMNIPVARLRKKIEVM